MNKLQARINSLRRVSSGDAIYNMWANIINEQKEDIAGLIDAQHREGIDGLGNELGSYEFTTEKKKKKKGTWHGSRITLFDDGVWRESIGLEIIDREIHFSSSPSWLTDYLMGLAPSHDGGEVWQKGSPFILSLTKENKRIVVDWIKLLLKNRIRNVLQRS